MTIPIGGMGGNALDVTHPVGYQTWNKHTAGLK